MTKQNQMTFLLREFLEPDYATYEPWFADETLNTELGPMDREWLEFVLRDTSGKQFVLEENGAVLAVAGIKLPQPDHPYIFVTDIATSPDHRGHGIGAAMLRALLLRYPDIRMWKACVSQSNLRAQRFFIRMGWKVSDQAASSGMLSVSFEP